MSWRFVAFSVVWLVGLNLLPYFWSPPGSLSYHDQPITIIIDHQVVNTYP